MGKTQERIFNEYIKFILEHKKQPLSILSFTSDLKMKESTFYKYFTSFDQLEKEFWKVIFDRTIHNIENQDVYHSYSINEKLLAFHYTLIEELKGYRNYAVHVLHHEKIYELYPSCFETFKKKFEDFTSKLVDEGLVTQEIASRPFITDKYKYFLWYQPVSILKFWVKDESKNFENTDALIEKTVNFSFDLMISNGLDSFFDLAKFHIQHF